MRAMRVGQRAFLYQSACKVPGVTGIVEIVKEAYPDNEQFDPKSKYYDSKAKEDDPKWSMVDIKFVRFNFPSDSVQFDHWVCGLCLF